MQARYGNTVTLVTRPRPTPMVGRTTDIAPFYGGDLITDGQTNCTSGFTITNAYGWQYMLTAGHCFALGIGVVTNNTWMGNVSFRRYGGGNPDAALIGDGSYQGIIWIGSASNPTPIVVHSAANSCNGCQVYFDGAITGQSLATLVGNPYCVYTTDNAYICGVQETYSTNGNQNCAPGDSGEPVFAYDGRGGAIAVGIVTAGYTGTRCLYTRVPDILSIWQSTITVG